MTCIHLRESLLRDKLSVTIRSILMLAEYIRTHLPQLRLTLLYLDFSEKIILNPDGFNANVDTWLQFLIAYIDNDEADLKFSFDGATLLSQLTLPGQGQPVLINFSIDKGVDTGVFVPWLQYKSDISLVSKVWTAIFGSNYKSKQGLGLKPERYLSKDKVQKFASQYWEKVQHGSAGEVMPELTTKKEILLRLDNVPHLFPLDVDIILTYWQKNGHCAVVGDSVHLGSTTLLDNDRLVISIKAEFFDVSKRNELVEAELDALTPKIKKLVADHVDPDRIKHFLRLKQILTKLLNQGLTVQGNMKTVLLKIDEQKMNITSVNVMETATQAMKELNAEIDPEKVAKVQDAASEEMSKIDDTTAKLGDVDIDVDVDETEVDEELEKMLEEEQAKEEKEKKEKEKKEKEKKEKEKKEKKSNEQQKKDSDSQTPTDKNPATNAKAEPIQLLNKQLAPITNPCLIKQETGEDTADIEARLNALKIHAPEHTAGDKTTTKEDTKAGTEIEGTKKPEPIAS